MKEKVLVVGGGGREHAIVAALQRSEAKVYSAMKNRNPGIARAAIDFAQVSETDVPKVVAFAQKVGAELAVIGPESPLEVGLADALREKGIGCVGPSKAAARLETSKSFARELMDRHHIAGNLRFASFDDARSAKDHIDRIDYQVAVKPIGLTGGKGVKVEGEHLLTKADVKTYIDEIFQHKIGGAGVVLEEKTEGEEFTLQVFCDGKGCHYHAHRAGATSAPTRGTSGRTLAAWARTPDADHLLPFVRQSDKERGHGDTAWSGAGIACGRQRVPGHHLWPVHADQGRPEGHRVQRQVRRSRGHERTHPVRFQLHRGRVGRGPGQHLVCQGQLQAQGHGYASMWCRRDMAPIRRAGLPITVDEKAHLGAWVPPVTLRRSTRRTAGS